MDFGVAFAVHDLEGRLDVVKSIKQSHLLFQLNSVKLVGWIYTTLTIAALLMVGGRFMPNTWGMSV